MNNRKTILVFVLVIQVALLQGCSLFKKKCDCPPVGKAPVRSEISKAS